MPSTDVRLHIPFPQLPYSLSSTPIVVPSGGDSCGGSGHVGQVCIRIQSGGGGVAFLSGCQRCFHQRPVEIHIFLTLHKTHASRFLERDRVCGSSNSQAEPEKTTSQATFTSEKRNTHHRHRRVHNTHTQKTQRNPNTFHLKNVLPGDAFFLPFNFPAFGILVNPLLFQDLHSF